MRRSLAEEQDLPSGSHSTLLTTQHSLDTFSGSFATMSVTDEASTLTVVPVLNNVAMPAAADLQLDQGSNRRRLFFAQASKECKEEHLKAWFSQYGVVEQVHLYNDNSNSLSSGCGYITMVTHEQAALALAAVQNKPQLPNPIGLLNVSWALTSDGTANMASPPSQLVANADRTVFFAKVPPTALASEVEMLFGSFGRLAEVNLFRAWAGAKHSKGCGLITYVDRQSAAVAIAQLHGKYVFPGSDCPMVVEWMDLKKQRPMAPPPPVDKPPLGCSCDAYKLMLSNIPLTISDTDMLSVLSQFGHVVQLGLAPDASGATASGHVWYATKQGADALLAGVKTEPLWLRDPRTQQDLALAVKKFRRPPPASTSTRSSLITTNGLHMSSSSNSSSSVLPILQLSRMASGSADMSSQLARMASLQGVDLQGLVSSDMVRVLPMQPMGSTGNGIASGQLLQGGVGGNGYMTLDMQEPILEVCNTSANASLSMPVQLQPALASQVKMGNPMAFAAQQRAASSGQHMCVVGNTVLTSGTHCMSSPANLGVLNEFEGSFSMPLVKGVNNSGQFIGHSSAMQTSADQMLPLNRVQQQMAQGALWQRQQQLQQQQQLQRQLSLQISPQGSLSQPLPLAHQVTPQQLLVMPASGAMLGAGKQMQQLQQQLQRQQSMSQQQLQHQQSISNGATAANGGGNKSIAIPIESFEVHLIADHLTFFANTSGAQVTLTSLPGAGLAVMISGRGEQVAMVQSLLSAARNQA